MSTQVICIPPFHYIEILNKNTNKIRLIEGPLNLPLKEDEDLLTKTPIPMVVIPNLKYIGIKNPVCRDKDNKVIFDEQGLPKYNWSKVEYRTRDKYPNPFPLYSEEVPYPENPSLEKQEIRYKLETFLTPQLFVEELCYLILEANYNFVDNFQGKEIKRESGERWILPGPSYYLKRDEVRILHQLTCVIVKENEALVLRANRNFKDKNNIERKVGQKWLMRQKGAYLPDVSEDILDNTTSYILDDEKSLYLMADRNFVDVYGNKRKAGEEWIITNQISNSHIIDVHEVLVECRNRIILKEDEYCVLLDPWCEKTKTNLLGEMKLIKGVASFFLNPGERLRDIENGNSIKKAKILDENEGYLVQAIQDLEYEGKKRVAGEKWMIQGPKKFIPLIDLEIIRDEKRVKIPLDKNEGIYIRNKETGKIFKHMGSSYFLSPDEELWNKELPENIEEKYLSDMNLQTRDKSRIIKYNCPFNSIMQIYNLKTKKNRIIFGPDFAVLDPEEEFTLLSLSGGTPKVSGVVKTLYLNLGPRFSTDKFTVETIDHTKLELVVSYDWIFDIKHLDENSALKIFTIRDFIGDMVKTLASKIRSTIATISFEEFHKNSDVYIHRAVFGENLLGKMNKDFRFEDYNLIVNNVDIRNVEPIDQITKSLLQKSVSLAIELTTKTYEQEFQIKHLIKEQEFYGEVEKLRIQNEINYIKKEIELNKLKVESGIIQENGISRANALAHKDAVTIDSKSKVDLAQMKVQANELENEFLMKEIRMRNYSKIFIVYFFYYLFNIFLNFL
jgi:major vault protein